MSAEGAPFLMDTWEAIPPIAREWDRLWPLSHDCRREFYSFDWVTHLARSPCDRPWFVVNRIKGETVAIAPLFRRRMRHPRLRLPFTAAGFCPTLWLPRHGFLGQNECLDLLPPAARMASREKLDAIVLDGLAPDFARALFSRAKEAGLRASLLQINAARGGKPGTAMADACSLLLPGTWDAFLAARSAKYRWNLKRGTRMAQQRGALSFWRLFDGKAHSGPLPSIEHIASQIRDVDRNAWQASKGLSPASIGTSAFLEALSIPVSANTLDVAFLLLDNTPIAYNIGLRVGDTTRSCFIAYDNNYAAMSPGVLLYAALIRDSIENTALKRIEFGGSPHLNKHAIANAKDSGFELTVYTRTARGRLLFNYRKCLSHWHTCTG